MLRGRIRRAFTLVEVLTAIGVLGLLSALLLSAVQSAQCGEPSSLYKQPEANYDRS